MLVSSDPDSQCPPTPTLRSPAKHQPARLILPNHRPVVGSLVWLPPCCSPSDAFRQVPFPRSPRRVPFKVAPFTSRRSMMQPSRARRRLRSGDVPSVSANDSTTGSSGSAACIRSDAPPSLRCRCGTTFGHPISAARPFCACRRCPDRRLAYPWSALPLRVDAARRSCVRLLSPDPFPSESTSRVSKTLPDPRRREKHLQRCLMFSHSWGSCSCSS